ncbi:hypothetical protein XA68_15783 [Ophiocordyceps unilateralis]|uniref:Uncharacterized protein n=1 Tax=Ophiocordyceps unilateralis TaxID=268505 RepID=A0A2A9P6T0_OPHUN|nr:hypothetical protein XA68_15783 [Ophiocordyceps unilateralis]
MVSIKAMVAAVVFSTTASALPAPARMSPRQAAESGAEGGQNMDTTIAEFARTLELAEGAFYKQVITQNEQNRLFSEEEVDQMQKIFNTEDAHATQLQQVLTAANGPIIKPCKYKFDTTDRNKILQTALVLEETGQAAYLGAAPLVQDKNTLALAGSILPVESQHATVLRGLLKMDPVPRPFSNALSPADVSTMVEPFIESCEDDTSNPLKLVPPNPQLQMQPAAEASGGANRAANGENGPKFLRFSIASGGSEAAGGASEKAVSQTGNVNDAKFCAFPDGTSARFVNYAEPEGCQQPDDLVQPAMVMLTREMDVSTVIAGPMPVPM